MDIHNDDEYWNNEMEENIVDVETENDIQQTYNTKAQEWFHRKAYDYYLQKIGEILKEDAR